MERDGINIFQSGFPLAIIATNNNLRNFYGAGQIWPNAVVGCSKQIGSVGSQARAEKHLAPMRSVMSPGPMVPCAARAFDNWDFSVGKTIPPRETVNLAFRAEAFNPSRNLASNVQVWR